MAGLSERAFLSVVALLAILLTTSFWRVFVAHADGRRAPKQGVVHGAKTVRQEAPRGILVDRAGRVLARSVLAYDVEVECYGNADLPRELGERILECLALDREPGPEERDEVETALRLPPEARRKDLWQRAEQRGTRRGPWQYYWKRRIVRELGSAAALRALEKLGRARYDGCRFRFRFDSIWRRVYPLGKAAAHVVGCLVQNDDGSVRELGLESLTELNADESKRWRMLRNARGRAYLRDLEVVPFADEFEPRRVVTTLDARMQEVAHDAIVDAVRVAEAEWGMTVAIDLTNGDVLALAGCPTYDPEFRVEGDRDWPVTHWARVEPGSVIKPLLVGLAVERGFVRPGDPFQCGSGGNKVWRMQPRFATRRRKIRDDHYIGSCRLEDILIQSSNIGAVKVGMKGGPALHQELFSLFRLGDPPDLGLPLPRLKNGAPRPGNIPSPADYRNKAGYEVYTGPSLSFGYQFEVYPLTFARAFASLVTGRRFDTRLLRRRTPSGPSEKILSDATVDWIRETLSRVVTDEHGTARHISGPEVDGWLAGKTGTTVSEGRNVSIASFVGFAPARDPRWLAMAVLQRRKKRKFYGGKFAAPVVRDVLSYARSRAGAPRAVRSRRPGSALLGGNTVTGSGAPVLRAASGRGER